MNLYRSGLFFIGLSIFALIYPSMASAENGLETRPTEDTFLETIQNCLPDFKGTRLNSKDLVGKLCEEKPGYCNGGCVDSNIVLLPDSRGEIDLRQKLFKNCTLDLRHLDEAALKKIKIDGSIIHNVSILPPSHLSWWGEKTFYLGNESKGVCSCNVSFRKAGQKAQEIQLSKSSTEKKCNATKSDNEIHQAWGAIKDLFQPGSK